MKTVYIKLQLAIVLLSMVANCFAQDKFYQHSEVLLLNKYEDQTVTLNVTDYSLYKKNAVDNAVKKSFNTLFFGNITGFNNGNPIIKNEIKTKNKFGDFFINFFTNGRYRIFVSNYDILQKPLKNDNGQYVTTLKIKISIKALIRELKNKNIIRGFGIGEKPKNTIQPTIMIVPYKKKGETYQYIIQNDFDKRVAMAKVQEGFDKLGFNTIDFEAKLNATLRANNFENESQISVDKQLLRNSGSDIYVTVDILKNFSNFGNQVSLILKGYETSSGKALAAKRGWSGKFRTNQIEKLCEFAVELIIDDFLEMLNSKFNKATKEGTTTVLNISVSYESEYTLDSEIGKDEIPLSDLLRLWVKNNAYNNYYHLQGTVSDAMIFDDIRVPLKDKNNNAYNQSDFAFDIWNYLKNTLGIRCKKRVDGQTIYITIQ